MVTVKRKNNKEQVTGDAAEEHIDKNGKKVYLGKDKYSF